MKSSNELEGKVKRGSLEEVYVVSYNLHLFIGAYFHKCLYK
jgi:hypothetical protein